jgi:branched-chain amino acid transport system permease protein
VAYSLARSGLLLIVLMAMPAVLGEYWAFQLSLVFLYAIVATGVGICWGHAGFLPLGQGMFLGLGAYISGLSLVHFGGSPVVALLLPLAVLVPGILAFAIGYAVFRGRTESGPFFALITLAFALLAFQIANTWNSVTGGFNGLKNIPDLPGMTDFSDRYYVAAGALFVVIMAVGWLLSAPIGVVWRGLSQNERRIAFFGYKTAQLKAVAFGVAGLLAGLAGFLYAPQQNLVTPTLVGFLISADIVIWAAVGGRRAVAGPALGAILIGVLTSELRDRVAVWEVIVALLFVVVVLYLPNGIAGLFAGLNARLVALAHRPRRLIPAPASPNGGRAEPRLAVESCDLALGDVRILDHLSFAIDQPRIYCLIGPNGAGKTSTFNVLSGELRAQAGAVRLDDEAVTALPAHAMARRGVIRKFQIPSVFPDLSVRDNLHIALWGTRARLRDLFRPSLRRWDTPVLAALRERFPFLADGDRAAGALSHGERQILELAMALAAEPRLLLLDEPCAGLSAEETQRVIETIRWARERLGLTAVVIEHDMSLVREIADHVFVLHQGSLLAEGDVEAVRADARVHEVYVGMAS